MTTTTYRAVQVSKPGRLEVVERELTSPPPGKVRIRVEACGVCHSDALTVEGLSPDVRYPRVPGHEVVGKIDALGEDVSAWKLGQRVGVGFLGGHCGRCTPCRRGDFVNCQNQPVSGVADDGGYTEVMIADERALAAVPAELVPTDAAPLLCAGVTTYNALRNSPARSGDLVAVQGIGGLGHLAVQFANRMGFHVAALGLGADKEPLARQLGTHHYINTRKEDPALALQALGGASVILATAPSGKAMSPLIGGLRARGRLIVVGVSLDPIEVTPAQLVFGTRAIEGSLTGSPLDTEDTLAFSALEGIRPRIETVPLEAAAEAYAKMMKGEARFRMVLVTGQ
jgi:D-arabinose 1-dehydrogenase-like Zn-dependent alcohol dehydrogenase